MSEKRGTNGQFLPGHLGRKKLIPLGSRFGMLTVIASDGEITRKAGGNLLRWRVKCDCGGERSVAGTFLLRNQVVTCGCRVQKKNAAELDVLSTYQSGARKRGLSWELTNDQFFTLIRQECFYCGSGMSNKVELPNGRSHKIGGELEYNGIDRKDSAQGYRIENCVACCRTCNRNKGAMSYDEFLAWIRLVYEKHGAFVARHY